jgi:uncharacterized peroxidase-related enzyme
MSRITVIDASNANPEQAALLAAIQDKLGMVPNFLKVLANSPAALQAFLGLHSISGSGSLSELTRERIALALAQMNGCAYCVSAHTAIGRKSGLSGAEVTAARTGTSEDAKAALAVKFARSLTENTGEVSTAELLEMRNAGYTDSDLVEIIVHVALNLLTNILAKSSRIEIDFPKVDLKLAA